MTRPATIFRIALAAVLMAIPSARLLAADAPLSDDTVLTPSASAAKAGKDSAAGKAGSGALTGPALLVVTAIVALGAFVFIRRTKNSLSGRLGQSAKGAIEICRVRSLGGKQQYLAVVQVEGKRMLLGIGPGFMTKLSDLENEDYSIPFERKTPPVKPAPEPTEAPTYPFTNLITRINDSLSRDDDKKGK
ncbi:MAG TPA: flagellar biosynthetic protein FliO [Opitutales bacterium]|nr:flagellar biosynthetic protein FliO [Opitutales bacterium]